jgi:hypothetical protein
MSTFSILQVKKTYVGRASNLEARVRSNSIIF